MHDTQTMGNQRAAPHCIVGDCPGQGWTGQTPSLHQKSPMLFLGSSRFCWVFLFRKKEKTHNSNQLIFFLHEFTANEL